MSWIPEGAAGDDEFAGVFGLRENLFHHFRDFYARLWEPTVMDPVVVELCRLRVAQLVGCAAELAVRSRPALDAGLTEAVVAELRSWPTAVAFDDVTRSCLGFAEQFVIDLAGIGADDRAELRAAVGFPRLVGLAQAVAAFDGFDRFRLVLGIGLGPELPSGAFTVVDVGEPDRSVPEVTAAGDVDPDDPARGFSAAQPDLFASFERLYGVLWSGGVVDHPSKEVARLRNARVTGCKFCRNVRFARARRDGLTEDLVDLVADGYRATELSDAHKAVIGLTDGLPGRPPDGPRRRHQGGTAGALRLGGDGRTDRRPWPSSWGSPRSPWPSGRSPTISPPP